LNSFRKLDDDDDDDVDINWAWKSIRKNIKASSTESVSYYALKQHTRWFCEECSELWLKGRKLIAMVAEPKPNKGR